MPEACQRHGIARAEWRELQMRSHSLAQPRQQFRIEPRVPLDPRVVAPRWMRQRHHDRTDWPRDDLAPALHRARQVAPAIIGQMPALGVLPDEQHQLEIWQCRHQSRTPEWCAFASWWQVATLGIQAWKAEAHGNDGDARNVIEFVIRHAHPLAQAHARGIRERRAGCMNARAWCLPEHANAGGRAHAQNRARLVRQGRTVWRITAKAAGTNVRDERVECAMLRGRSTRGRQSCRRCAHYTSTTRPSSASRMFGRSISWRRASMDGFMCVRRMRFAAIRGRFSSRIFQLV